MKFTPFFLTFILPILILSQEKSRTFEEKIRYYKETFKIDCVIEKATDNKGNGQEILYGTRNFRSILHGIAYRGGGNNYYHRTNKRGNKNPLPQDGLNNLLKGNHDFSTLSKNNPDIINKKCFIYESFWQKCNNELIYTIKANRFLHHMVRFIVGTSIEVARSKLMIDDILKMINNSSSKFPMCAPPKGLFLSEVLYD